MAEIIYEGLYGALESTRGTAIAAPTHRLNVEDTTIDPDRSVYRPKYSTGTRAEYITSTIVRENSSTKVTGPIDLNNLTFWANMAIGPATITTPGGGTLSRLHTFPQAMTTDTAKSADLWWGDPNVQVFRSTYNMLTNLTLTADADSTDAATFSAEIMGKAMTAVTAPTLPAFVAGTLVSGVDMSFYIDTSSAIGTTELTGRVLSVEARIDRTRNPKYHAKGAGSDKSFDVFGIGRDHAELTVVLELNDMVQYNMYAALTEVKARVRMNGPLIEGALYNYAEFDIFGPLAALKWGKYADTNRTVEFTIMSQYGPYAQTAGYDYALKVQNTKTTD